MFYKLNSALIAVIFILGAIPDVFAGSLRDRQIGMDPSARLGYRQAKREAFFQQDRGRLAAPATTTIQQHDNDCNVNVGNVTLGKSAARKDIFIIIEGSYYVECNH